MANRNDLARQLRRSGTPAGPARQVWSPRIPGVYHIVQKFLRKGRR